jgi:hypothetical protein
MAVSAGLAGRTPDGHHELKTFKFRSVPVETYADLAGCEVRARLTGCLRPGSRGGSGLEGLPSWWRVPSQERPGAHAEAQ